MDALDHDDGVVDQHASAERQPGESDDVEAEAVETHQEKCRKERHRHGRRHDQRRTCRAQEDGEHDDGESDAESGCALDFGKRVLDQRRLVGDQRHVDVGQVAR